MDNFGFSRNAPTADESTRRLQVREIRGEGVGWTNFLGGEDNDRLFGFGSKIIFANPFGAFQFAIPIWWELKGNVSIAKALSFRAKLTRKAAIKKFETSLSSPGICIP